MTYGKPAQNNTKGAMTYGKPAQNNTKAICLGEVNIWEGFSLCFLNFKMYPG